LLAAAIASIIRRPVAFQDLGPQFGFDAL